MDDRDVAAIKTSFAAVAAIKDEAAALFYRRLFEIDPSARPLFKGDLHEQGRKLMASLALVVGGLGDLPSLVPAVRALGVRHLAYGVEDRHYDSVGAALLWTLEQGLGAGFTPELRAAWAEAYGLLAATMKAAAAEAALAA